MRRRTHRSARGFFPADAISPLFRAIAFLVVLVLFYSWVKRPQSWQWLDDNADAMSASAPAEPALSGMAEIPVKNSEETVVPGPTDQDPEQAASAQKLFQAVSDREPLAAIEMPAYWRCLKWARSQSFAELERRAADHVVYTQLWEQPDKYRGKLLRLRLHIRRILEPWPAPENSAGVSQVYEAWGFTDESKSYPYLVVFSELPAGMKIGENLQEDGLFVGYFLKTIKYTAFDKNRYAPLLLGRLRRTAVAAAAPPIVGGNDWVWLCAIGVPLVLLLACGVWFQRRRFHRVRKLAATAPTDETEMENWFQNGTPPPLNNPMADDVSPPGNPFSA